MIEVTKLGQQKESADENMMENIPLLHSRKYHSYQRDEVESFLLELAQYPLF